ncbi:MAG: energy transducer TonB [bacterium]|nr:energy transducer TonB [bacterium]
MSYANIIDELLAREFGALVLRDLVGKNTIKGVIYSSLVAWVLIGGWYGYEMYKKMTEGSDDNAQVIYIDPTKLALPPIVDQPKVEQVKIIAPTNAPIVAVKAKAVEDSKVADTVQVMEIKKIVEDIESGKTTVGANQGQGDVVIAPPVDDEYIPKADEFVPVEKQPEIISAPPPEYPEMARTAGLAGTVIVQFLVNKKGEITKVKVLKASPPGLGFEDKAMEAVKKWKMKPAINNGQPVAIWVTQPIRFKLK